MVPDFVKVAAFGRLCVRSCLHLTQKEKLGPEPKGFGSFAEIAALYTEELQKQPGSTASASKQEEQDSLKVEDMVGASASQVALHHNAHMEVGKLSLGNEIFSF